VVVSQVDDAKPQNLSRPSGNIKKNLIGRETTGKSCWRQEKLPVFGTKRWRSVQ
jgi:hypothetical protein